MSSYRLLCYSSTLTQYLLLFRLHLDQKWRSTPTSEDICFPWIHWSRTRIDPAPSSSLAVKELNTLPRIHSVKSESLTQPTWGSLIIIATCEKRGPGVRPVSGLFFAWLMELSWIVLPWFLPEPQLRIQAMNRAGSKSGFPLRLSMHTGNTSTHSDNQTAWRLNIRRANWLDTEPPGLKSNSLIYQLLSIRLILWLSRTRTTHDLEHEMTNPNQPFVLDDKYVAAMLAFCETGNVICRFFDD